MLLAPLFERFAAESPLTVMARAAVEHALNPADLDALFARQADRGYTKELLFSAVVDLLSLVVTGTYPSVHAAYQKKAVPLSVSVTSVYNKLAGIEDRVSAELVRHTARRLEPVLRALGQLCPEPLPGYRTRVLDGNHLAATEHRLEETRTDNAAPLPGQALVVYEPALRLVTDIVPCEDAHAQERSLLDQVLAKVAAGEVWLGDRNFCVQRFLLAIAARGGFFIIREHKQLNWRPTRRLRRRGRVETGEVFEQRVALEADEGEVWYLRRVVLVLDEPTREGETEIVLLSNLPEEVRAQAVAEVYRDRWTIEGAFLELTTVLRCEVNTLCYPKAALFAFCVAVAAYNVQGVLQGALRAVHGAAKVQEEVSAYYVADEIAGVHRGMMIAIPAEHWLVFRDMAADPFAALLRHLASKVRLSEYRKHPRGPKKPRPKRRSARNRPHVATARLL